MVQLTSSICKCFCRWGKWSQWMPTAKVLWNVTPCHQTAVILLIKRTCLLST